MAKTPAHFLLGFIQPCINKIDISNISMESSPQEIYDTILLWFEIIFIRIQSDFMRGVFDIHIHVSHDWQLK